MKAYEILTTPEFDEWENSQTKKEQVQIDDRLDRILSEGHFGDHKSVSEDDSIWELRWKNGRRVYYSYLPKSHVLILLGGNKNGQKKDITRAGNILSARRSD
jgi:putative addiction module killer protein